MSIKMNNEYVTNDGSSSKEKLKLPAARPVDELRSSRCRESSKCKEVIPFYCSSLANPVRLRRTTGNALAGAFSCRKAVGLEECSNEFGCGGSKSVASDV